jgi:hypothetical protein
MYVAVSVDELSWDVDSDKLKQAVREFKNNNANKVQALLMAGSYAKSDIINYTRSNAGSYAKSDIINYTRANAGSYAKSDIINYTRANAGTHAPSNISSYTRSPVLE